MNKLLDWKNDANNKPLMVLGARQVGKTYIINEFCKVAFEGEDRFELYTVKRKYGFKTKSIRDAKIWAQKINEIIFSRLKRKY